MKKQKISNEVTEQEEKVLDEQEVTEVEEKKKVTLKEFLQYVLAGYLALLPFFLILIGVLIALLIIFLVL